jgi:hypothetical protein
MVVSVDMRTRVAKNKSGEGERSSRRQFAVQSSVRHLAILFYIEYQVKHNHNLARLCFLLLSALSGVLAMAFSAVTWAVLPVALRLWMLIVTAGAFFGSFLGFFGKKYVKSAQFDRTPEGTAPTRCFSVFSFVVANSLSARLFGVWTFVAGTVRLLYVLFPRSSPIILCTMVTFVVVFLFYSNEIFNNRTVSFKKGLGILILSGTLHACPVICRP